MLGSTFGLTFCRFNIALKGKRAGEGMLVFFQNLVDEKLIDQFIVSPLAQGFPDDPSLTSHAVKQKIYNKEMLETDEVRQATEALLRGYSLLLIDGCASALLINTYKPVHRTVNEPPSEITVKGPRDGYVEDISMNIALLRQRLPHPQLQFEEVLVGKYSKTKIIVAYIRDLAEPELIETITRRLSEIEIDNVPNAGEIEQLIEDQSATIFPTIGNTQRPDKTAALLVEGRAAVFVDGTPVVLSMPHMFFESLQSPDDYSSRQVYASLIRLLRFIGLFFSVLSPSFFIAALNFQKEMIPSSLIFSLTEAREKVSIPLTLEVVFMMLVFEILREASLRMPKSINNALSIIGALVLGDVAVSAGLIGAPTMVVVSISAIFAFVITPLTEAISLLRLLFIIPATLFGIYGLVLCALIVLTHMVSLTSMGTPYMAPLAPTYFADWKDFFIRGPLRWFKFRPKSIPSQHKLRLDHYPKRR